GGGISVTRSSIAEIFDNTISGNSAWNLNHGGGGIIISYSSNAIINNNEILNNKAYRHGGGIYVRFNSNNVTITNNLISENKADGYGASNGGGIYLNNIVEAIVHSNTISKNWAEKYGGGIYVYNYVDILKGAGGVEWIRNNFPPEDEPHNDYDENTHGDDSYGGANVFFSD
ncbi:MAG: right-handed parallel beta-helix repeat-containing protein, partial [Bacteroidota bacterium]